MQSLVDDLVLWITLQFPDGTLLAQDFAVRGLFALILVSLVCGAVGSLVISNRMAFFSDALAHCAFSGIALGVLISLILGVANEAFLHWLTLSMVCFGVVFGLLIAFVEEKTALPSDTVIGVFFAGSLGLGAIFTRTVRGRTYFSLENFIFGDPLGVRAADLLFLMGLLIVTVAFLVFYYNALLFRSFNPSLAQSRRVPSRTARYLFIALLGVIVNLCQQTVGILLINGLLIVPGAAAANLSRNMRQLLWWSVGLSLLAGVMGLWLSWEINVWTQLQVGVGGMVVMLSVIFFTISMVAGPLIRGRA